MLMAAMAAMAVFIYLIYHDFTRDVSSCGHTNRVDVGDQQRDKNVKMLVTQAPLQSRNDREKHERRR